MPNDRVMSDWLEQVWLQRYLDRALTQEETEWFEVYVLDKAPLIARIEADNDLRDGLALAELLSSGSEQAGDQKVTARDGRRSTRHGWQSMAWAASVVAALGMGWMLAGLLSTGAGAPPAQIVASPTRIVFDTLRGVESPPLIHPGDPNSAYVLVEVGLPPDATNVVLHLEGHEPMPLVVSPDGFASFLLPRGRLGGERAPRVEYVNAGVTRVRELEPLFHP